MKNSCNHSHGDSGKISIETFKFLSHIWKFLMDDILLELLSSKYLKLLLQTEIVFKFEISEWTENKN